ncbi:MAG: extracellular solute-binding protein [Labilithrix sp.]|nr:extracellular solute-binding protein [Labilithrix sp.]MCW5810608.1 extracellular solute-binding protein [Labilithrix sp.]
MRKLLALLVTLVVVALGCGEPPKGVTLWHPYRGGEEEALKLAVLRFEQERGVKVTSLFIPYEAYIAKLEAAIPRGNGPDVFLGPHNRIGEYVLHQLIGEAGDALPESELARYEPITVESITFRGKRWAVPLASKCVALYYNPRFYTAPPKTLEEIVAKKGQLGHGVFPLAYEAESEYFHASFLHAYGGKMFDPQVEGGFAMEGEAAEKSLLMAKELVGSGVVPEEASGDLVKQLFASGKAGAVMSGPWLAADLKDDLDYRVTPLPTIAGVGPMRPFLTVDGAFLTPEGAKSADARALARSFGSDASAFERATIGKQVVATRSYWALEDDGKPNRQLEILRAFHDAVPGAIPIPVSTAMNPVWDPVKNAIRKVIRGAATPRDALAEAKARYEDVMREPKAAESPAPLLVVVGLVLLAAAFGVVRRVRAPGFAREFRAGKPAYKYVLHAALVIFVLVVLPLVAGAITSFFAGPRDQARFVGLANYVEILTARGKPLLSNGSFYLTLLVTVVWTVLNVIGHVGIGLVLGIALARPMLKLRAAYRVLLILPWAVPSYVTALAWKGMFHRQFGAINAILVALGAEPISWFSKFSTAFAANVATNVWLGFPFMMVVVMGALTSISKDVLEAAEVDGATRWQTFRLVTLPLLKPTLLPAVVLGSVWTFNMFNVVYLVSGGQPDGTTDILVSEAYRWAFARNAQLGYAAAYAVIIFGVLALMSRTLGRIGGSEAKA